MKQLTIEGGGSPQTPPVSVEAVVDRITFANEENGWSVLHARIEGEAPREITVVGHLPGVQPGETLRLTGRWVQDRNYGEQLKAESFITVQPSSLVGIEKYLGSGLVRGVGRKMAGRLVERFGLDTLEVIDREPERLVEVEGIGPKRSAQITTAWAEQRSVKEVMLFLQTHGVSPAFAVKIHKQYGERAITIVKENPFRLAVDIFGIGFRTADRIAQNIGLSPSSPRRAEAGLLHVLGELSGEGHVYAPRELLLAKTAELLGREAEAAVLEALGELLASDHVAIERFEDGGEAVYSKALFASERGAARRIRAILEEPAARLEIDIERAIAWFEENQRIELAELQREAVRRAVSAKILVITGGPGTGKTTIVNAIIRILERKGKKIALAAPTGRAAKRLQETTEREASTIHRLLEFDPRHMRFSRDADHPLEVDAVIIDEMSMVDIVLFNHLLKAVRASCQLVLVGDVDQLPSVGPGSVLGDLIRSGEVPVVRLTEIFRQARESLIVVNAHRVNSGQEPLPGGDGARGGAGEEALDFYFVERERPEEILALLCKLVSERIPARFGLDPVLGVQVLTPMHRGTLGAQNLNATLQGLLNPTGESLARGSRVYRVGDKVMQIRNNYDLEVFNGDIGRIEGIDAEERRVLVGYEGRSVPYDFADLDELVLSYACTIHKAQGSEYPSVVIPIHTQHYTLLQRNLLYTAITRGKKLVVLVGSRRAVRLAVANDRREVRFSRLAERLRDRGVAEP
jgi:exodeoxyribonuclease V alpha subunit